LQECFCTTNALTREAFELLQISEPENRDRDMKLFIREVCGHIEFNAAPEKCPVCSAPGDQFKQNDNIFKESEEKSKEASAKHIPFVQINHECKLKLKTATFTDTGRRRHLSDLSDPVSLIDIQYSQPFG
jgi:hypothetical protein